MLDSFANTVDTLVASHSQHDIVNCQNTINQHKKKFNYISHNITQFLSRTWLWYHFDSRHKIVNWWLFKGG